MYTWSSPGSTGRPDFSSLSPAASAGTEKRLSRPPPRPVPLRPRGRCSFKPFSLPRTGIYSGKRRKKTLGQKQRESLFRGRGNARQRETLSALRQRPTTVPVDGRWQREICRALPSTFNLPLSIGSEKQKWLRIGKGGVQKRYRVRERCWEERRRGDAAPGFKRIGHSSCRSDLFRHRQSRRAPPDCSNIG